MNKAHWLTF
jgi:hypothetical protein